MQNLKRLTKLSCGHCHLKVLPPWLGKALPSLRELDVRRGTIKALPDSICALKELVSFNASWNRLSALPEDFGALTHLRRLGLWANPTLTALPESMSALRELRFVSVERCRMLTNIPEWTTAWTKLQHLNWYHRIPDLRPHTSVMCTPNPLLCVCTGPMRT